MAGLFTHPDCAPAHGVAAGQVLSLTSPVQEDGVTLFRAILYVCVGLDARCQGVQVAPASQLGIRFEPVTVHIEPDNHSWVDQWSHEFDAATVRLRYPAPVTKLFSSTYRHVALHRVDGDAVAEQATVSAALNQVLPQSFVGAEFHAALTDRIEENFAILLADATSDVHQQAMSNIKFAPAPGPGSQTTPHDLVPGSALEKILFREGLNALDVNGLPGTPRLLLFDSTHAETLWQWMEPGEHSSPVFFNSSSDDLVALLQPAFDRAFELKRKALDEQTDLDATRMVLPLVIESDSPCRVVVGPANLIGRLEVDLLQSPVGLSFTSGADNTQTVVVDPPPGTRLGIDVDATVAQREAAPLNEPPPLPTSARHGIQIEPGGHVAVPWQADRPYWLCGIAFGWYALSERTVLNAAIFPDAGGNPTAQPLAEGRIEVSLSSPGWVRGRWPDIPIQPGVYWLRLRADEGFGVWLGLPGPDKRQVWMLTPPAKGGSTRMTVDLLVTPLEGQGAAFDSVPRMAVALNGAALALSSPRSGAVAAQLAEGAPLAAAGPWSLDVTTALETTVTLQSVRVVYQL